MSEKPPTSETYFCRSCGTPLSEEYVDRVGSAYCPRCRKLRDGAPARGRKTEKATLEVLRNAILFFGGALFGAQRGWGHALLTGLFFACLPAGWEFVGTFWKTNFIFNSCGVFLVVSILGLAIKLVLSFALGVFVVLIRLILSLIDWFRGNLR